MITAEAPASTQPSSAGRERHPGARLIWAARGCLALTVVVIGAAWQVPTDGAVFVNGWPVRFWVIATLTLVASVVLFGTAGARRRSAGKQTRTPARTAGLLAVGIVTVIAVAGTTLALGVEVVLHAGDTYVTLPGGGDDGCRVIVRERSLLSTSWDVYEVGDGIAMLKPVSRYLRDDARTPLRDGRYRADWTGDTVNLRLEGQEWSQDAVQSVAQHTCT